MMVHSFKNQHVKITYEDKQGKEGFLKPGVSSKCIVYLFPISMLRLFVSQVENHGFGNHKPFTA